ncbi:RNB-domain-containing protein [Nadsonia fulvescens var. elongata DSM 6958]|uniref:RNB-domain-containing protein n=1 Tax=Nadsonia fulvescens var. elongata DSM 6958 TaxID=857566 RepID=A0A1E3PTG7_9ASCO|nr:RNB-domain-containing protein [Nadsonia fulvescens var. elongata DSM 6958]
MHNTQDQGNQGRPPRNLHIAHRRTPSELTPLMVEQLALQQQIEALQAQQQQIIAQQQQIAQSSISSQTNLGLSSTPPPLQPTFATPTGPFGQFSVSPATGSGAGGGHRRTMSSTATAGPLSGLGQGSSPTNNNSNTSGTYSARTGGGGPISNVTSGHNRRHSLALEEAKRAAAIAQAKRSGSSNSPGNSAQVSPQKTTSNRSPETASFPPEPETSDYSQGNRGRKTGHGRSQSLQQSHLRNNSPLRNFQFPTTTSGLPSSSPSSTGGHNRTGSRNFDSNWRQQPQQQPSQLQYDSGNLLPSPSNFVPSHRSRGSFNNSVSSISAFNMYNQPTGSGPGHSQQRKSLFAPYLPQASLSSLMAEGRLVSGILRVNKKNRSDAYVSTEGLLDADIFICGSKDRNRALEGDLVAIELLDVDEVWDSKKEKEEKKRRKDSLFAESYNKNKNNSSNNANDATAVRPGNGNGALQRRGSLKQRPSQKRNDDIEVEGQSLLLTEEDELSDSVKPLYAGHVVAVIDRVPGQLFSGTLGLLRPSSQATKDKQDAERREKGQSTQAENSKQEKPKIIWFKPTDKCVPLIAIPTEQAPDDFIENIDSYTDRLFVASIKRWPITSLHPFGTLVEELGSVDDENIQIDAIFRNNNFTADVFPESVTSTILSTDTSINYLDADATGRRQFVNDYTLAISPSAGIADEAFHIKKLSDEKIELGIHVSDVTEILNSNPALDREAKKRGTSVYLVQRTMHMFPQEFNDLCSLSVGEVRPTVSVVFEIDAKSFEVTDTWIGKGTIKTRCVLDYEMIEMAIASNGASTESLSLPSVPTIAPADLDYVKTLILLSTEFKKDRYLTRNNYFPGFGLLDQVDDENVKVSTNIFKTSAIAQAINEINIKTNATVAQKLYAVLGSKAFLRRHQAPYLLKMEAFIQKMRSNNLETGSTSSIGLQNNLLYVDDLDVRKGLETLMFKCMVGAKYFVAGKADIETYSHYYFNLPLYTHFTSPLRRYADVIVQRQIKAIIEGVNYDDDIECLHSSAEYCNFRRDSARNAQEQSIHLSLSQGLRDSSPVPVSSSDHLFNAVVLQVYASAFDILIPQLGIEKRVHGDQLPLVKAEFHQEPKLLELFWQKGVPSTLFVSENEPRSQADDTADTTTPDLESSIGKLSLENIVTRVDNDSYIQEIRELQHIPVILRVEFGKTGPCLTVRVPNPFT